MKHWLKTFFFFITISGVFANGPKSISINHIGEHDTKLETIVINTEKQGIEFDRDSGIWYSYYIVQESTFDEIVNFIYNNNELFREREWLKDHFRIYRMAFEICIENERVEYYYMIDRQSSELFFNRLRFLIMKLEPESKFIGELISICKFFRFPLEEDTQQYQYPQQYMTPTFRNVPD